MQFLSYDDHTTCQFIWQSSYLIFVTDATDNVRGGNFVMWRILDVDPFQMWRNIRCGGRLLQFTLFCRETCLVAIYALSMWRKIDPKILSVEKKLTNIRYGLVHILNPIPLNLSFAHQHIVQFSLAFFFFKFES